MVDAAEKPVIVRVIEEAFEESDESKDNRIRVKKMRSDIKKTRQGGRYDNF